MGRRRSSSRCKLPLLIINSATLVCRSSLYNDSLHVLFFFFLLLSPPPLKMIFFFLKGNRRWKKKKKHDTKQKKLIFFSPLKNHVGVKIVLYCRVERTKQKGMGTPVIRRQLKRERESTWDWWIRKWLPPLIWFTVSLASPKAFFFFLFILLPGG